MASMTMLAAIRETLLDEMERDERVVLLGEDIGVNGGVFRATDGALARFGPQRVFDTPISESAIVGASVGLSVAGLVPVAEIQFAGFTMQAYHQLVGQLARRSGGTAAAVATTAWSPCAARTAGVYAPRSTTATRSRHRTRTFPA